MPARTNAVVMLCIFDSIIRIDFSSSIMVNVVFKTQCVDTFSCVVIYNYFARTSPAIVLFTYRLELHDSCDYHTQSKHVSIIKMENL
jgi:hypothetical protein